MRKFILIALFISNTGFCSDYMFMFNGIKTAGNLLITVNCEKVKGSLDQLINVQEMVKRSKSKISMPVYMPGKMKGLFFVDDHEQHKSTTRIWFKTLNQCKGFVHGFKATSDNTKILKR
jgi:hypothetical protein